MTRRKTTNRPKRAVAANRHRNTKRRVNRRRNPHVQSLVMGAAWAAIGAIVTTTIAGFIPIGGGGLMQIVKQGVAAYATVYIGERFTSPRNAELMGIGGFASAAGQGIQMLLSGGGGLFNQLTSGFQTALPDGSVADLTWYPGMGDLVEAPDEYDQPGY